MCGVPTHPRKFALLVHIEECAPLALGKTCRYCSRCELIIAHKDELDAELAHSMARLAPEAVGREYLVLGTLDRKVWKQGLEGKTLQLANLHEHMVQFRDWMRLEVDSGGWRPVTDSPSGQDSK